VCSIFFETASFISLLLTEKQYDVTCLRCDLVLGCVPRKQHPRADQHRLTTVTTAVDSVFSFPIIFKWIFRFICFSDAASVVFYELRFKARCVFIVRGVSLPMTVRLFSFFKRRGRSQKFSIELLIMVKSHEVSDKLDLWRLGAS